ncbi:hypothetical protein N431DRAFT_191714 [Stipitochalara longipes BDJ]|nr:hypothetical protein N431DRAFT_191714 [Stipitochalara longipes BDJ]
MLISQRKVIENLQVSEGSDLRHRTCGSGVVAAHGKFLGGELCLDFKWTDVQEGLTIPAVLELGLLEGSTFPATSCSFRQLRALRRSKMGQRDESFISFRIQELAWGSFERPWLQQSAYWRTCMRILRLSRFPGKPDRISSFTSTSNSFRSRTCESGARVRKPHRYCRGPMRYARTYIDYYGGNRVLFSSPRVPLPLKFARG